MLALMTKSSSRKVVGIVPHQWLSWPKISDPIPIQGRPNLFLFALRTPLPEAHQDYFSEEDRWTLRLAAQTACNSLSVERASASVISIETNAPCDYMDEADWTRDGIEHYYLQVDDNYSPDALNLFCQIVDRISSPGPVTVVLVSSHNGIHRPGFLIAGFLIWYNQIRTGEAISIFNKHRGMPIAERVVKRLLEYCSDDPQNLPLSAGPETVHRSQNCDQLDITPDKLRVACALEYVTAGGQELTEENGAEIAMIQALIGDLQKAKFQTIEKDRFPLTYVWSPNRLSATELHKFKATYAPRGTTVFVVIVDPSRVYIVIPTGSQPEIFVYHAIVTARLPVICMAVVVNVTSHMILVLTDVCRIGESEVSSHDLSDRQSYLCWEVFAKVQLINGPRIAMRVVGQLNAERMLQLDEKLVNQFEFHSDGIVLIEHGYPAGMTYFIPIRPTVRLFVLFNADHDVILYGRADTKDGLVPLFVRRVLKSSTISSIDKQTCRFELAFRSHKVKLRAIGVELSNTFDFASYVKEIYDYLTRGGASALDLEEIQQRDNRREHFRSSKGTMGE
jgi:hypothetical protein